MVFAVRGCCGYQYSRVLGAPCCRTNATVKTQLGLKTYFRYLKSLSENSRVSVEDFDIPAVKVDSVFESGISCC